MDIRYCILAEISIHVPAWGTTQLFHLLLNMHIYFNPRSRVGNDASDSLAYRINSISIHVPAWGTTLLYCAPAPTFYISIHVPAWGTTDFAHVRKPPSFYFNPRSRVGNDCILLPSVHRQCISIHVPAWGTTTGCATDSE